MKATHLNFMLVFMRLIFFWSFDGLVDAKNLRRAKNHQIIKQPQQHEPSLHDNETAAYSMSFKADQDVNHQKHVNPLAVTTISLSTMSSSTGVTFTASSGNAGYATAFGGDIDNDGNYDILIGNPNDNFQTGKAYIVFGRTSMSSISLSTASSSSSAITITGESGLFGGYVNWRPLL